MEFLQLLILIPIIYFIKNHFINKFKNLPPAPFCLPIIGHLHLIKKPLHRTLAQISTNYGPITFLRFGSRPVLLVSSPAAAEECLTKNDIIFANRPRFLAGKHLGYNYTTLVWASYGDHWRNLRKIATLEILSSSRIQMFSGIRSEEVKLMIEKLVKDSIDGGFHIINMKSVFFELTLNIMMRMIAGKRYYGDKNTDEIEEEARRFKEIVTETFQLSGSTNIVDFLPILKWVGSGLNRIEKKMMNLQEKREEFMQDLVEEHRGKMNVSGMNMNRTMIEVLLVLQETEPDYYTDEIIKGLMQVLISGGTDTSSGTMEWALSLLLNNPESLKKAQDEIDIKIGRSRLINDSDLDQLPYLRAIINETLRMYPASPVLPAHESSQDCTIGGYNVPRGTMLLVNLWAIQNDPSFWTEPTKFMPERFLDMDVMKEKKLVQMPFGHGRRGCPGENLAIHVVGLGLGSLIQCFEWERPNEEMLDMSEGFGLTMPKAQPLLARCRPRESMLDSISTFRRPEA